MKKSTKVRTPVTTQTKKRQRSTPMALLYPHLSKAERFRFLQLLDTEFNCGRKISKINSVLYPRVDQLYRRVDLCNRLAQNKKEVLQLHLIALNRYKKSLLAQVPELIPVGPTQVPPPTAPASPAQTATGNTGNFAGINPSHLPNGYKICPGGMVDPDPDYKSDNDPDYSPANESEGCSSAAEESEAEESESEEEYREVVPRSVWASSDESGGDSDPDTVDYDRPLSDHDLNPVSPSPARTPNQLPFDSTCNAKTPELDCAYMVNMSYLQDDTLLGESRPFF